MEYVSMSTQTSSSAIQGITLIAYIHNYPNNDFEFIYNHCLDSYICRFTCTLHSFFLIRMLFLRPRLNVLIFLPILGWKYSCNILNYSLWHISRWLVLPFRERNNFIQLSKHISLYCMYKFSTHEIIFFSQFQRQVYS